MVDPLRTACQRLNRSFTDEEWRHWFGDEPLKVRVQALMAEGLVTFGGKTVSDASGKALNAIAKTVPWLIGGAGWRPSTPAARSPCPDG